MDDMDGLTLWDNETVALGDRSNIHERKDRLGLQEFHPDN
jgi:hypothetical protein